MSETETKTIKYKHPNRTQVGVRTREVPKIEYNDKDVNAYNDLDLEVTGDSWQVGKEIPI